VDYGLTAGVQQGLTLVVAAFAALGEVASVRVAQVALGPIAILSTGLSLALVPGAAHKRAAGELRFYGIMTWALGGVALCSAALGVGLYLMPYAWGVFVFGSHWHAARTATLLYALALGVNSFASVAVAGLRVMGRSWTTARARIWVAPATLAAVAIGASLAGATLAMTHYLVSAVVAGLIFWALFRVALHHDSLERVEG
jgi:O-antigen/teichoic acid export membrane protein